MKVTNQEGTSDHHLNMMHRINLIPPTYRGNQLRKYLAFMYLQCLGEVNQGISLPTNIQVAELTDSVGRYSCQAKDKLLDIGYWLIDTQMT